MPTVEPKLKAPRILGKTSTCEILGQTKGGKAKQKFAEHLRRLTRLRDQFLKGRTAQTENAREQLSTSTDHIADAATDSYDRDCALALLSSTQNALYEIDQALNRISNGTYGKCELSGQPIEKERLKAIPWTRFSAVAQAQIEARSTGGRVQLGQLGSLSGDSDGDAELEDETEEPGRPALRGAVA